MATTEEKVIKMFSCSTCEFNNFSGIANIIGHPCRQGHVMPVYQCHARKPSELQISLPRKNVCTFCQPHKWFPSGWEFCPKCGTKLFRVKG